MSAFAGSREVKACFCAGQYTDAESGLIYLRARYYDPATGQFLTRDPIESITRSAYGYVGGNPLNATDPLGLFCVGSLCTPKSVGDALGGAWDATGGRVVSTAGDVVSAVPDVAYDVQGWIGRNIVRPTVGFGIGTLGLTIGSNIGLLIGDAVCGVGPWAIPCALAGGAIGGAVGLAAAVYVWRPIDSLLSRIPGWSSGRTSHAAERTSLAAKDKAGTLC
jgi:RHS repeat-associated protein